MVAGARTGGEASPNGPSGPSAQWRLRDFTPADRLEGWREVVASTHLPWRVDAAPVDLGRPFDASVRRRRFREVDVLDCRCDPCAGARTDEQIRRTAGEHVGVLAVLAGREVLEQDGRRLELRAGDVALWDSTRPARFAVVEPLVKRTLLVPRDALRVRTTDIDGQREWTARQLGPGSMATDLLRSHLRLLERPGGTRSESLVADLTAELVAACIDLVLTGEVASAPVHTTPNRTAVRRAALHQAVVLTIESRLDEVAGYRLALEPSMLSPASLARAHAVSVRGLQQAFEESGETVAGRVRRRRLEHARDDLDRHPDATVSAVAARWGFADAAHFTRAFRDHFGAPPSEVRARPAPPDRT